jgi:hypothetical protein
LAGLKSYFYCSEGCGGSGPNTHGSSNVPSNVASPRVVEEEVEQNGEESAHVQAQEGISVFNSDHIISDLSLHILIDQFAPNIRDEVRRAFIAKGPTQPISDRFPQSRNKRSFQIKWFKKHSWLEYSLKKNCAYCFYCYLFKHDMMDDKFCYDAFTKLGFSQWKNAYLAFPTHVGGPKSIHNNATTSFHDFSNQRASVKNKISTYSKYALVKYESRLEPSLSVVAYLALQGESFRGHDKTSVLLNRGNFLEMLDWYKERNEEVKQAFDELCPKNAQMTSGMI